MVEHGSSVSKIKEILKNSKSVKKSDEILDDLFSSIKEVVKSSTSDDDGDDESNSDDSEEEKKKRKKSKKKKKKKDKKLKKKKKRHKHSSDSESEREEDQSRSKRRKPEDDTFWGGSRPYDEDVGKEVRKVARERREPEYNDERRPVDLGRVARPYPQGREVSYPPEPRSEYRREEWRREEYDREDGRSRRGDYERERERESGRRREERGGRERKEYEREEKRGGGTVMREMSVASVASTVGGGKDGFWDTKWDAMKLDEKIQEEEKRGQYYLNTKKRFKQTMGEEEEDEGTPSLSPSPEREKKERKKKKKEKEREEECDELKGIRKLADIAENKVEGDGKVKGAVPDSKDYEYDRVTRMYKKKDEVVEKERVKKGLPHPEELKQPEDEEEEERIRLAALEQDKNELCVKADLSNVDEIPMDVLLKAKRRVESTHYHDPNIDASQVLNPRKAKLLNPSKAAMDKAFPRNEVKQRSEVVKKIAEMHREAQAQAKKAETKDEIMEELVKEIEELENEVGDSSSSDSSDDETKINKVTPSAEAIPEAKAPPAKAPLESKDSKKEEKEKSPEIGMKLDWGDSALAHLQEPEKTEAEKEEEKKKEEELRKKLKEDAEKAKKEGKLEDGEVDDGVEEGEVSSDEDRKKRKKKKRSRSKSRSRRRSYSRRSRSRSRKRSRSRRRSYSRGRSPYERRSRRRSPSPYNRYGYSRKDLRDRSYSRERRERRDRSRSRERRRQQEDERYARAKRAKEKLERSRLNKEKLLEIAKKNAAKILKSGGDYLGMDTERLIAMKSGGQSLDEITKFCKEISKKGLENEDKIDLLADSDSSEEEFQHPFMVKDKPLPNPIQMLVGEAREVLPPAARAVAKSQRMLEFPVSSGNAHRSKEGAGATPADPLGDWEPVKPQEAFKTQKEKEEMERFHDSIQREEQALAKHGSTGKVVTLEGQLREAMLKDGEGAKASTDWEKMPEETPDQFVQKMKPWTLTDADKDIAKPKSTVFKNSLKIFSEKDTADLEKLKPKKTCETDELGQLVVRPADDLARNALELKIQLALPQNPKPSTQAGAPAPVAVSSKPDKVFDKFQEAVVDIGTIVSTRLNAMRKLQQNPNDADALADMYEAQKLMASWAQSKNKPGQFVGSTGATVLSKHELSLGLQCWAKPDQFTKAEKVSGGFGEYMLKKMGWTDGEGLGKHKSGEVNPLQLDIKFDKKGLMAAEEEGRRKGSAVATMTACKDLAGKHPVSALTELCSKRRWGPPIFTQAFECGPPHKKQYIIKVGILQKLLSYLAPTKVNVNGTEYMGSVAVNDKKKAKANAAMYCLQTMGLVPKDPDNPV